MLKCKGLPVPHVVGFTQEGTYDRCSGLLGSPGTEVSRLELGCSSLDTLVLDRIFYQFNHHLWAAPWRPLRGPTVHQTELADTHQQSLTVKTGHTNNHRL